MPEPRIWPRMDERTAEKLMEDVSLYAHPEPELSTESFGFSGVGVRADARTIKGVRSRVLELARGHGFDPDSGALQGGAERGSLLAFDRELLAEFRDLVPMNWSEAGARDVWSWFALALLPDVTHWRWYNVAQGNGRWNPERWIGSDLTRHTWARQWWRTVQLEPDPGLGGILVERDYNATTERANTIGSNPRLVTAIGRLAEERTGGDTMTRTAVIREASKRILRDMAYLEDTLIEDGALESWVGGRIDESIEALRDAGPDALGADEDE